MKDMLKIMTCGSVDDGKSTLIGHLIYDAGLLFADQEKALELESSISGDGGLDYSLLLDGLSAEREQGITIDVAYRYFATKNRSFIVADTPGHEEYTRNMAVAASASDIAILLVDATKGVLMQTARHLRICGMMGIKDFVFAVNKMDLAGYSEEVFESISKDLIKLTESIKTDSVEIIPLSALAGDNITGRSDNMRWYDGSSLLEYLEAAEPGFGSEEGFVMPVQRVSRTDGRRYLQGNISCGDVKEGDEITIYPGRSRARVESIVVSGAEEPKASEGMAVSIALSEDMDISRGHVLTSETDLRCSSLFEAKILWMDEAPLTEGRSYLLKLATQTINVTLMKIKYAIDPESGKELRARRIEKNGLACVDIVCHEDLVFDSFERHREMGRFILIDKITNSTAGCGTVMYHLRRGENLTSQEQDVSREMRAASLGQKPMTIWFTGLSGSGKSALANEIEKQLAAEGRHTMLLDGDNVRQGINRDLGFNDYDRTENIRRLAEICKLLNDAGIIAITAFISPFAEDRQRAREIVGDDSFMEIYVSTPIEECERRDVKGLYKRARAGEIPNFTGIGSPYEAPDDPDAVIDTSGMDASSAAASLLDAIRKKIELK